jgi:UDP-N-acetylglucosamine 2-epimerase (non-hydrolysing)
LNKKKIAFVFGTRPEAIKIAPFIKVVKASKNYLPFTILTGQHPTMARQFLGQFNLEPDVELFIDRVTQSLNSLNSQMIDQIGRVLVDFQPDMVIVQGDTASAFAGAVAAFNMQVPVAHLEAGLRTNNIHSPYPEEAYRQMISRLAEIHMCPTNENRKNLEREGVPAGKIMVTGNTVVDAFKVNTPNKGASDLLKFLPDSIGASDLVLVTAHRRENLGENMSEIAAAIRELALLNQNLQFVMPMHPNPSVRERLYPSLQNLPNVHLLEPLEYPDFISLLARSKLVLTDSGGVQEEAPILGIPTIVMRDNTERPEGVTEGGVVLVGARKEKIVTVVQRLLANQEDLGLMATARNPYGDGNASSRCTSLLDEHFGLGKRHKEFKIG